MKQILAALSPLILAGCSQPLGLSSPSDPSLYGAAAPGGAMRSGLNAPAPVRSVDRLPDIIGGLTVSAAGRWGVRVDPGSCTLGGKTITVREPVTLQESPVEPLAVTGERVALTADRSGATLKEASAGGAALSSAVEPASVVVWSSAGGSRTVYRNGADYLLDGNRSAIVRTSHSSIPAGAVVSVDYRVRRTRLDTVEVKPDGTLALKHGEPGRLAPIPASPDAGSLAIANIYLERGSSRVSPDSVFSVGPPLPPPTPEERQQMAAAVARTRAKLQANGKVLLAFWGDTEAGASNGLPSLVVSSLESRFKGASVKVLDARATGVPIRSRLASLERDVLSHHPDLVVVEFLNEAASPNRSFQNDLTTSVRRMKAAGSEVILTTPRFTAQTVRSFRDRDRRPGVAIVRQVARAEHVGLADVSRSWEHLAAEGIPYTALLANGTTVPDERGEALYTRAYGEFF